MDELTLVDLNEIELVNANELLILKDEEEVERFKAEKEATRIAKKPVIKPVEEPVDKTYMERFADKKRQIFSWKDFVEEADLLFNYLLSNYHNMLDGEDKVKHFDVLSGDYSLNSDAYEIKERYSNEIQMELVPWIRNESRTTELFKMENWRPFRDPESITDTFLGYRRFFKFKHYYFLLTLSYFCDNDTYICTYCKKKDYGRHFGVALHGWKDINCANLQPVNVLHILDDNMYPESHWFEKE
jgi:hypothetical protein